MSEFAGSNLPFTFGILWEAGGFHTLISSISLQQVATDRALAEQVNNAMAAERSDLGSLHDQVSIGLHTIKHGRCGHCTRMLFRCSLRNQDEQGLWRVQCLSSSGAQHHHCPCPLPLQVIEGKRLDLSTSYSRAGGQGMSAPVSPHPSGLLARAGEPHGRSDTSSPGVTVGSSPVLPIACSSCPLCSSGSNMVVLSSVQW